MSERFGKTRILTVCTGNICRSPMAEGMLKKMPAGLRNISVASAGTHALTGNPATDFALIAAHEKGIDISGHRARLLEPALIQDSDIILCMEPSHAEWVISVSPSSAKKVYILADFSGPGKRLGKIADPYGCGIPEYRECINTIEACLRNFLEKEPW